MPIYVGNQKTGDLYYGGQKIKEAYYGSTMVYSAGYPSGEVLFESSTPGTYTLNVEHNCVVEVHIVGGGGGGRTFRYKIGSSNYSNLAMGGGSGAYVTGNASITAGIYSIVVGGGGAGHDGSSAASGGGSSSCFSQTAGGGGGGGTSGGGSGGVASTTLVGTNGNAGGYDMKLNAKVASASGGASRYGGYGKGGDARRGSSGNPQSGGNGYVKITVV